MVAKHENRAQHIQFWLISISQVFCGFVAWITLGFCESNVFQMFLFDEREDWKDNHGPYRLLRRKRHKAIRKRIFFLWAQFFGVLDGMIGSVSLGFLGSGLYGWAMFDWPGCWLDGE